MTSSLAFRRFALAYGAAFAALYVIALKLDLALVTVYPSLGVVLLGTHHSRDVVAPAMGFAVPAMYWYGWTATAALGALLAGLLAASLPEHRVRATLVGLGVVGAHGRDGRLRLPDLALVSAMTAWTARPVGSIAGWWRNWARVDAHKRVAPRQQVASFRSADRATRRPGVPRCSRETDHDDHHPRPGGSNDEAMLCARHTRGGRTLGPGRGPSGHGADGRAARAAVRPRGHGAGARRQAPLRPLRRPLRGRPGDDPAAVAVAARRHRGGDEELPDLAPGDRRAHGRGR